MWIFLNAIDYIYRGETCTMSIKRFNRYCVVCVLVYISNATVHNKSVCNTQYTLYIHTHTGRKNSHLIADVYWLNRTYVICHRSVQCTSFIKETTYTQNTLDVLQERGRHNISMLRQKGQRNYEVLLKQFLRKWLLKFSKTTV